MRIIFNNEKKETVVLIPAPSFLEALPDTLSDYEKMEYIAKKDIPKGIEYFIIDKKELPTDQEFRDAWEIKNKKININFDKAKEITKNRLRRERKPLLDALDIEYIKAIENKEDVTEIINEKQKLRDITKLVDKETTLSGLKQITINGRNNYAA